MLSRNKQKSEEALGFKLADFNSWRVDQRMVRGVGRWEKKLIHYQKIYYQ